MKIQTLVVNLFAGPSVGKTTAALGLAYNLKLRGIEATYIPEYAKELVSLGHMNLLEYQDHITAEQMRRLRIFNGVSDVIVVDSPIPLTLYYAKQNCAPGFRAWVLESHASFNNLNYFLNRNLSIPYQTRGRYQDEETAILVDGELKRVLDENAIDYTDVLVEDGMIDTLIEQIRSEYGRLNAEEYRKFRALGG